LVFAKVEFLDSCISSVNECVATYSSLLPFGNPSTSTVVLMPSGKIPDVKSDFEKDRKVETLREKLNVDLSRLCIHVYMKTLALNPQGVNPNSTFVLPSKALITLTSIF